MCTVHLHFHSGIKLVARELHKQPGKLELYSPSIFSSCLLFLWQRNPFSPNRHSFHLNFYINITKPMTVTADGQCKNVLAFGVVNVAWITRNGDFCHFILIPHQISTRVHSHIQHIGRCKGRRSYSFTGSAQFCSVPNTHSHFLFPLMNMQPKNQSTLFPYVVMLHGKAQILKGNAGPDFYLNSDVTPSKVKQQVQEKWIDVSVGKRCWVLCFWVLKPDGQRWFPVGAVIN